MALLTDKQELFAITWVSNGNNATAAYRECYDVGKDTLDTTVWVESHKVLHNPKVAERIAELREQHLSTATLGIEERKRMLSRMALEGDLRAIDLLNKMEGVYVEKQKVELTGSDGKPIETKWTVEIVDPKDKNE